jgi:hypothetical protein
MLRSPTACTAKRFSIMYMLPITPTTGLVMMSYPRQWASRLRAPGRARTCALALGEDWHVREEISVRSA